MKPHVRVTTLVFSGLPLFCVYLMPCAIAQELQPIHEFRDEGEPEGTVLPQRMLEEESWQLFYLDSEPGRELTAEEIQSIVKRFPDLPATTAEKLSATLADAGGDNLGKWVPLAGPLRLKYGHYLRCPHTVVRMQPDGMKRMPTEDATGRLIFSAQTLMRPMQQVTDVDTKKPYVAIGIASGWGVVQLDSTPPGARIFVKGKYIGDATCGAFVTPGNITVKAEKPGFTTLSETIVVFKNASTSHHFQLVRQ